jgi:hypothetical protein
MNNQKVNIFHYFILVIVLFAGLILLFTYKSQPNLQFYIGVGIAISYFSWGIVHHYLLEDLHRKHVVEYGLIAILGIVLLKMILL